VELVESRIVAATAELDLELERTLVHAGPSIYDECPPLLVDM
jgi:hypothetical protein